MTHDQTQQVVGLKRLTEHGGDPRILLDGGEVAERADHHDRDLGERAVPLSMVEEGPTRHLGHPEVEHDQIDLHRAEDGQRVASMVGEEHVVPAALEGVAKCIPHVRVIVDDQHRVRDRVVHDPPG